MNPIRVLIVDDSALVRRVLSDGLSAPGRMEVIGSVGSTSAADAFIAKQRPDVITLDMEMPGESGLEYLRRRQGDLDVPVVVVSAATERGSLTAMDALAAGAIEVVAKPKSDVRRGLDEMMLALRGKVMAASRARVQRRQAAPAAQQPSDLAEPRPALRSAGLLAKARASSAGAVSSHACIAIGASTGGTQALKEVLIRLPVGAPPVVIVQHMPAGFTKAFADRMNEQCKVEVLEAKDGDRVRPGRVLIAPGAKQMHIAQQGPALVTRVAEGDKVNGHCPSVEPMFDSLARLAASQTVAVMLTGMGDDGASAMARLRQAGAHGIAQDEASCVVFGMPKVAIERGGADEVLPLDQIADAILLAASRRPKA